MVAPVAISTGAEPDQPESYPDETPERNGAEYAEARYGWTPPVTAGDDGPELGEAALELGEAEPGQADYQEPGQENPERERRRMGWFGIVVLLIAVLAVAAAGYALVNHGFKPKTKLTYQPAAIFTLQAGECLNGQNSLGAIVLPCSSPHLAQVFATFQLPSQGWPGQEVVQAAAKSGCQQRLASYLNPQLAPSSTLSQEYIYPDQTTWASGGRTVVCDIRSDNGLITGSVGSQPVSGAQDRR